MVRKSSSFTFATSTLGEKIFYISNYSFLLLFAFATIFPLINIIATSLSSTRAVVSNEVVLWPVDFTVLSYIKIIENGTLLISLKNTIVITLGGTLFSMLATIMIAYPLSKKRLRGRNKFLTLIIFTMMFSGGLIPTFILIRNLGLADTYWALWLLGLCSTWNMFVMKTSFEAMPASLEESAMIDGASDFYILYRIVIPLSKAVIATLTLFYAVGNWNSYFNVMIYITSPTKQSVMVKLMQMVKSVDLSLLEDSGEGADAIQESLTPESLRASAIVVATIPIMLVYPFLQKYFVKGVMIGSIKG